MPWRRRYYRLLVQPLAQFRLFAPFFVFMVAWTAVLMLTAWVYKGMVDKISGPAQSLTPYDVQNLQALNKTMFQIFMWGGSVSIMACFGFYLVFSHKVFGPIVQIHRHIKMLTEGNTDGVVKLRANDEFEHLAEAVNELTE